jgi:hypothetical protein
MKVGNVGKYGTWAKTGRNAVQVIAMRIAAIAGK